VDCSGGNPVHKTRRDIWDGGKFQNRVDNAWETNMFETGETRGYFLCSEAMIGHDGSMAWQ